LRGGGGRSGRGGISFCVERFGSGFGWEAFGLSDHFARSWKVSVTVECVGFSERRGLRLGGWGS